VNDDELEQLVFRLERPSPSPELDARIAEVTRHVQPARSTGTIRGVLRLGAAIACAGVLGFVLGRQSMSAPPVQPSITEMGSQRPSADEPEGVEQRAFVPANEAFVQLVTKPKTFVSVFGAQPLEAQPRPSEIQ
jgi:hypothetical protein